MVQEIIALFRLEAGPVLPLRNQRRTVERRLGLLVGHLQKEQEGDLLRVGHVRQALVPQDVGEVPGF